MTLSIYEHDANQRLISLKTFQFLGVSLWIFQPVCNFTHLQKAQKKSMLLQYTFVCRRQHGIHCNLVTDKSKVSPLKRVTIPRLELCIAILATKLLHFVATTYQDLLHVDWLYAWNDSTTALV